MFLVFATPNGQTIPIAGPQKGQIGGAPTQFRLGSPTALMTNNGQIINAPQILNLGQLQAMANFQNISQGNQTAMLGNQPVYIRAAGLNTAHGIIHPTIQAVQPQRNVPNKVQALVQPTTRASTTNHPTLQSKSAQVQPTLQPATQQQRNVPKVKGLKQQPGKQLAKQPAKHSPTEQHMATVAAATGVPRPPVQLKPKLAANVPPGVSMGMVQRSGVTTTTATVFPTVLAVRPTVSPPAGSPMFVASPSTEKDDSSNQSTITDGSTESNSTIKLIDNPNKAKSDVVVNKKTGPRKGTKKIDKNKIITPKIINITPQKTPVTSTPPSPHTQHGETNSTQSKSTTTVAPLTTTISKQEVAAVLSDMKEEPMESDKIYGDDVVDRADQTQTNNNNILMHYIEGFIIEEGPEPFPVSTLLYRHPILIIHHSHSLEVELHLFQIYRTSLFEKTKKLTSRVSNIRRDKDDMDVSITGEGKRTSKEIRQDKKARRKRAASKSNVVEECGKTMLLYSFDLVH